MITRIFLGSCIALLIIGFGCHNGNPVSSIIQPMALSVVEANCTEVWLKISVPSANNEIVTLKRDTTVLDTIRLMTADTTIVDTKLLPSHSYTYTLAMAGATSVTAQAKTMDTTSHAFTWQSYTLGDGSGSCTLYDVAIINDTLAYAVGEIYQGGTLYNLAKWNGQKWNLQQLLFEGYPAVIYSVFAINDTDVWFDSWCRWNGQSFQEFSIDPVFIGFGINKMWGNSSDMYAVGNSGFIAHYNGTSWNQISSGTTLDVRDIWGATNANTGSLEIYATAGNPIVSNNCAVLQISGTTAQAISTSGIYTGLNGMWFSPGQYYWIVGDGIWEKHPTLSASSWSYQTLTPNEPEAVRGNALNDVFMCGAYGEMLHFNGVSWKSYISQTGINGAYLALSVKGNTVIAVGEEAPQAAILMGKR